MRETDLKIAIVHDYLNQLGGAERVVGVLHEMFPGAPIYTLLLDQQKLWPSLKGANVIPSFLSKFKFISKRFKLFFWLYPFVMRTFKLRGIDVVISSSSAYAKGVPLPKKNGPIHICYCHTPMRFAWNFDQYIANETSFTILRLAAKCLVPFLKMWDKKTSRRVDAFIANSNIVAKRIRTVYQRESQTIYPPVELVEQRPRHPQDFFLVVSRLVAYKRVDLAIEACNMLNAKLIIVGDGPDKARLKKLAGPNVVFLGFQPSESIHEHLCSCKALLFPGEEDFGMTPVEAHAQGCPVVAYRAGGALDTIIEGVNGLFFDEPSATSLASTVQALDDYAWDAKVIRSTAERFSRTRFEERLYQFINDVVRGSTNKISNVASDYDLANDIP